MKKLFPIAQWVLLAASALAADEPASQVGVDRHKPVLLRLPTPNKYLLEGREDQFYQMTIKKRVIGGKYGFTRSTDNSSTPLYFDVFHEGIDIKPVKIAANGAPLDPIFAAADGKIVYINTNAQHSNYGYYIIVEHDYGQWKGYTTYAHLASVSVKRGQSVRAGEQIGVMGYSGRGIQKWRAHLHFEFGFRINDHFVKWFDKIGNTSQTPNYHGIYNGLNYICVDPAPIILATYKGSPLDIDAIFQAQRPLFSVRVPASSDFAYWQKQFPQQIEGGLAKPLPAGWEIICSQYGIPLKWKRCSSAPVKPTLVWFDEKAPRSNQYTPGRLVIMSKGRRALSSESGQRWFSKFNWPP